MATLTAVKGLDDNEFGIIFKFGTEWTKSMILVITMTESLSQIWSWIDAHARSYADGVESRKKKPSPEESLDVFYFRKPINTKLLSREKIAFVQIRWGTGTIYMNTTTITIHPRIRINRYYVSFKESIIIQQWEATHASPTVRWTYRSSASTHENSRIDKVWWYRGWDNRSQCRKLLVQKHEIVSQDLRLGNVIIKGCLLGVICWCGKIHRTTPVA